MSKVNRKITKEVTDLYFDKYDVKISLNNWLIYLKNI
jgi:hypothetical protein